MSNGTSPRVEDAVQSIAAECSASVHPMALLHEHYRRLQADPTWSPDDVLLVYQRVVAAIKQMFRES